MFLGTWASFPFVLSLFFLVQAADVSNILLKLLLVSYESSWGLLHYTKATPVNLFEINTYLLRFLPRLLRDSTLRLPRGPE